MNRCAANTMSTLYEIYKINIYIGDIYHYCALYLHECGLYQIFYQYRDAIDSKSATDDHKVLSGDHHTKIIKARLRAS